MNITAIIITFIICATIIAVSNNNKEARIKECENCAKAKEEKAHE